MANVTQEHTLLEHLQKYGDKRYQEGLEEGLKVAEKICVWLDVQPPRKYAQRVKRWGEIAITRTRNSGTSLT